MILMPFAPNIITGDETLLLRRFNSNMDDPAGVQIVDGKRVLGDFVDYQIACNVQPIAGDDLIMNPEGVRFDDQYNIWVWDTSELPRPNDFIQRQSDWFLVMGATSWGSYVQGRMQRQDVGPYRALGFQ